MRRRHLRRHGSIPSLRRKTESCSSPFPEMQTVHRIRQEVPHFIVLRDA